VDGNIVRGIVPAPWRRVGVLVSGDRSVRLYVLEPAGSEDEINAGPFFVHGRFRIAQKINNARAAQEAWKTFTPEAG
jgi:hypothetical protein